MDEMNDNELSRQLDREVSGKAGLVALVICLAVVAGIVLAGGIVFFQQLS